MTQGKPLMLMNMYRIFKWKWADACIQTCLLHDVTCNWLIVCSPIVIYPWNFLFILLNTGEGTENDLSLVGCMRHWAVCIVCQFHAWSVNKMIVLNEYNKGLIPRASHNLTTFVGKVNFRLTNRIKGSSRWTWITWLLNRHRGGARCVIYRDGEIPQCPGPPALKSRSVGLLF